MALFICYSLCLSDPNYNGFARVIKGNNISYLGPPGTAKSLLVRTFAKCLGIRPQNVPIKEETRVADEIVSKKDVPGHQDAGDRRLFEYLLTRYTTPEELFGGTDIQVLLDGSVYCRRTTGMLPRAEIAFLDEIFKANSAILNTLLTLINERIFYNMGQAFRVNLAFVVGASNETPDEAELGALYDRFPIRVPCYPVPENKAGELIQLAHKFACGERLNQKNEIPRRACLNDIRLLSKIVLGAAFGGQEASNDELFKQDFENLFLTIRRDFGVSDRTPAQVLRLCRALGLLDPAQPKQLSARHLRPWGYVAAKFEELTDLQRLVQAKIQEREPEFQNPFDRPT